MPGLLGLALLGFSEQTLLTLLASGTGSISEWLPPLPPKLLNLCDLSFRICHSEMMEPT